MEAIEVAPTAHNAETVTAPGGVATITQDVATSECST